MQQYLSILRGINVSGQKSIKMADLKALYVALGLSDVRTYIQSGNVLFTTEQTDKQQLKTIIEQAIVQQYGFNVPVELRTISELNAVQSNLPFANIDLDNDGTKVLITFLSDRPDQVHIDAIAAYVIAPEKLVVDGQTAYLHCPNGYGNSKLSNTFIEKKLGVIATTRNLKTINALCELAKTA